jgi:hypothetical protein
MVDVEHLRDLKQLEGVSAVSAMKITIIEGYFSRMFARKTTSASNNVKELAAECKDSQ